MNRNETQIKATIQNDPILSAEISNQGTVVAQAHTEPSELHVNVAVGIEGKRGKQGYSAYEIWLQEGNEGTIDEFLHRSNTANTYVHNQVASETFWDIKHSLEKFPAVTVVDSGDNVVIGDIEYISPNQLTIRFSNEFSGKAYLN